MNTLQSCDRILNAASLWKDSTEWERGWAVPLAKVTKTFQELIPIITRIDLDKENWTIRLERFKCSIKLHYEPKYDKILIAIAMLINALKEKPRRTLFSVCAVPTFDLASFDPPPRLVELETLLPFKESHVTFVNVEHCAAKDLALFIIELGYFPLDLKDYSEGSLRFMVDLYETYPHLPVKGIEDLVPTKADWEVHKLCEKLWLIAINHFVSFSKSIPTKVGRFIPLKEKDLTPSVIRKHLTANGNSSLLVGRGERFQTVEVVPPKALHYDLNQMKQLFWFRAATQFKDGASKTSAFELTLYKTVHPDVDPHEETYADFVKAYRLSLRVHELTADQ